MSVYAASSNGYNFHRENCGMDGEECPTAEHGESRTPVDHDHALALVEHRQRGHMDLKMWQRHAEAIRLARLEAVADVALSYRERRGKSAPDGGGLARAVMAVDHDAALRMQARLEPAKAKQRSGLTVPQERALTFFARLAEDADAVLSSAFDSPPIGTVCALIRRGLVTASPSGRLTGHQMTDAGWAALGR